MSGAALDIETYDRHAEKLREELALARIDRTRNEGVVDQILNSWNHLAHWLGVLNGLRQPVPRVSVYE